MYVIPLHSLEETSFRKVEVLGRFSKHFEQFVKLSLISYQWCFQRIKYTCND